jgi:hypothetical protein
MTTSTRGSSARGSLHVARCHTVLLGELACRLELMDARSLHRRRGRGLDILERVFAKVDTMQDGGLERVADLLALGSPSPSAPPRT